MIPGDAVRVAVYLEELLSLCVKLDRIANTASDAVIVRELSDTLDDIDHAVVHLKVVAARLNAVEKQEHRQRDELVARLEASIAQVRR